MAKTDTLKSFLREIYEAPSRSEYLSQLRKTALKAKLGGKTLVGSSGEGFSTQYLVAAGWSPDETLSMCEWGERHIGPATIEEAIATVGGPVTEYRTNFSYARAYR